MTSPNQASGQQKLTTTTSAPAGPPLANPPVLVEAATIASRLSVPVSWVLRRAGPRTAAGRRMPSVMLGRYRRFEIGAVDAWLKRGAE
jgi:hypothetical protein